MTYLTEDALWLVESDPAAGSDTLSIRTISPDGLRRMVENAFHL
ncbi:MAG: hypothetical protein ACRDN9_01165 [Streptosporangiaceae bacterium]